MAHSYYQIYIHAVFAVKFREALIEKHWKEDILKVIGNLFNESGCKVLIVNGTDDHVHCLFCLKPTVTIADVMKNVKAKSSKWVNEKGFLKHHFEWQEGYSSFSYSQTQIDTLYRYIKNQEEHHKKQSFRDEYIEMLRKFGIEFEEKYLLKDII